MHTAQIGCQAAAQGGRLAREGVESRIGERSLAPCNNSVHFQLRADCTGLPSLTAWPLVLCMAFCMCDHVGTGQVELATPLPALSPLPRCARKGCAGKMCASQLLDCILYVTQGHWCCHSLPHTDTGQTATTGV